MKVTVRDKLLAGSMLAGLAALGFAGSAEAQQAPAPAQPTGAENASERVIVVTGSRLRRETLDSPNPTVTVGSQEIEERQLANVGDAIEDIPLVGSGGNARGTQTQNGDSFLLPDILDLGSQRTLTLLNGRRIQPTLPGTVFVPGNASGSQVDLSTINPLIIDRVEVVAGTGGAIYGADAVGGVLNIITKDDYDGMSFTLSGGATQDGEGQNYRIAGLYGKNLWNDRFNFTISVDYAKQDPIYSSADSAVRYLGSSIGNVLDGASRDTGAFSAATAANTLRTGGTLAPAFNPSGTDARPSIYFGPLTLQNPLTAPSGVILTRQQLSAGFATTSQVVPTLPVNPGAAGTTTVNGVNVPFFAPNGLGSLTPAQVFTAYAPGLDTTGLSTAQQNTLALQLLQRNRPTPYEYFQANPNLNPLLFLGTFGTFSSVTAAGGARNLLNGYFPTVANTDPATSSIFPRVAVPLQFDGSGNLVSYNPGNYRPPELGQLGASFGGEGYDSRALGHQLIQAGLERASFGGITRFDVTKNVRWRTENFYSKTTFDYITPAQGNTSSGDTSAGSTAVPIYINQNPFLSTSARGALLNLEAAGTGFTLPVLNGERVLFLGRSLNDLLGGGVKGQGETESFRILQALDGEFQVGEREFYWDVSAYYGRSETVARQRDFRDIEFALAVDVVQGPNGPVCRQQTLAAPERIDIRNPGLSNIVTGVGLVPTAAQVASCVPLNLFGAGRASAAAINYVTLTSETRARNTLEVYSGSFGGDVLRVPAGWMQVGVQVERRYEGAEFEPNRNLQQGLGRTALQFTGGGEREFDEYGFEATLPVFGDDFNFPLLRELEFSYAFRQVEREQTSPFITTQGSGTDDDTFNYSFRYKPIEDLTLRGARSRTVRSASLVELFDPGLRAFGGTNAQSHPCATVNIDAGPAPATRRANCVRAVQLVGIAPDAASATAFLASFTPTTFPNRPATAAGNPFLANEEANSYTIGLTYEPSFIKNLTFAVDFFSVDLSGELGLVGTPTTSNACFDSPNFPNSIVGAANPACDAILLNGPAPAGGGQILVPTTNQLTGRQTILTNAFGGQPSLLQSPFEIAAIDFLNLNLAQRQLRAVNYEVRYNFELADLPFVGDTLARGGKIFLRGTVYQTQRYDVFTPALNRVDGEHGNAEYETRFDIRHKIGKFDHTLQYFWTSETVTNVQLTTSVLEQSPAFFAPDFDYFNYFASYEINDNFSARLTINNLFDTDDPRGRFGLGNDFDGGVGREFVVGLTAKF